MKNPVLCRRGDVELLRPSAADGRWGVRCRRHGHTAAFRRIHAAIVATEPGRSPDWCVGCMREAHTGATWKVAN